MSVGLQNFPEASVAPDGFDEAVASETRCLEEEAGLGDSNFSSFC